MLRIPEGKTCFVCTCEMCGATAELDETKHDDAAFDMRSIGWLPMPKKGQKIEAWAWRCPKCKPSPASR